MGLPNVGSALVTSEALKTFEIEPKQEQTGSVIWMHGLGATNHDFDDVIPLLDAPGVRFVFPAAPVRPVTINGGMVMPAWYDIVAFDDPPLREDATTVRHAEALVEGLLDREIARGTQAERIVLMGFSQGGAMALHNGVRYRETLAGIAVLSGYLLLPDAFEAEAHAANRQTPVLCCHGEYDPVVQLSLGKQSYEAVRAAGHPCEWHTFPMPHSLCLPEVEVLKRWLTERGLRSD